MDLKGCSLELAHRNSQASVPFYISNKGYGFLWHNAAIGQVHFGLNETQWITGREVYLPVGASWTHAKTGKVYEGGKSYYVEAELETLPIFLREGEESYLIGKI